VRGNQLGNVDGIIELPGLREMLALENPLKKFPDFSNAPALREISLGLNEITSLETLASSGQVLSVNVAENKINTLEPLLEGEFHGTLVIQGNPLDCEIETETIVTLRGNGINVVGSCVEDP